MGHLVSSGFVELSGGGFEDFTGTSRQSINNPFLL